ncbi:hypothetical protein Y017_13215 [Alcanivorax sp. 97CO-5]|uniref:Csu type fimbrial protein n=1 Tax=unclassified Alcanivorax TaxID=2638842 RepID=UPI0003E7D7E7|nr:MULTISPECIES: spore coat U domain-containing protein [unclassified Alcanivorax]EUC69912.1 hypothetical protein Y017_13215 [Alcanivorax sp. 97CO-5]PKG01704.1 hypothetical protein Y019_08080 [Alcanivorax sp. 97CO-6]
MKRLILVVMLTVAPVAQVAALECSITNSPILDFGIKDPFDGGVVTATTSIQWFCRKGLLEALLGGSFNMCIFVGTDSNGGVLPRNMTPTSSGPSIPFNIYTSSLGSTVIQPTTNAITVPVNFNGLLDLINSGTVTAYGIVPSPIPSTVLAEVHNTSMLNSQVRGVQSNQSCDTVGELLTTYTLEATIEIPDQCQITAHDLDFGTQSSPLPQTDSDTFIDVRCTNTSPFTVGLSDGLNPSGGSRRMRDGSQFVSYGLFQDAARSIPWDSTTNRKGATGLGTSTSIMMSVFGRIPAAPSTPPGNYTDTITVDIEF